MSIKVPKYYRNLARLHGYNERDQNQILREYMANGGVNLDPAETAWCAGVLNASLEQSGYQGTGSLAARSFLNWGAPVDTPQIGDVAVFSRPSGGPNAGHVGFYAGPGSDGNIRVLGGNQGDAVTYAEYPADRLLAYRRPGKQVDVRMASTDYDPGSTDMPPYPTGDPRTGRMDSRMPPGFDQYEMPPNGGGNREGDFPWPQPAGSVADTVMTPQLAQLMTMLPQGGGKPNPWQMLANMGVGILNAGGGPGAGNWFGKGLGQGLASLESQSKAAEEKRKNDLYAAQTQLAFMGRMGIDQPSPEERARGLQTIYFQHPQTGQTLHLYFDKYARRYIDPATGEQYSPEMGQALREEGWQVTTSPDVPAGSEASGKGWEDYRLVDGQPMTVDQFNELPPEAKEQAMVEKIGTGKGSGSAGKTGSVDINKLDQAIKGVEKMYGIMFDPKKGAFESADMIPGVPRVVERAIDGLQNAWNALAQDPDNPRGLSAELYERQLASIAGTLARAFGDTGGALSEGDIKRALDSMPRSTKIFPDSKAFAQAAYYRLLDLLYAKRAAAAGGLPPSTNEMPSSREKSGEEIGPGIKILD